MPSGVYKRKPPRPLIERFWERVEVRGEDDCWFWTAACFPSGYGAIRDEGQARCAHRVSYQIDHGHIPQGLFVLHHCDERRCVNPKHLYAGTQKQNVQDAWDRDRMPFGEQTVMSKLTEADVVEIRRRRREGESLASLSCAFGVGQPTISMVARSKTWKRVSA